MGVSCKHVRSIRKRQNWNNNSQRETSRMMGTTTGWRRNTSFDLAKEEQEEDGSNVIGFSSKRVAKTRENKK